MPPPIKRITSQYLHEPVEVSIRQKTTTAENIRQRYLQVHNADKPAMLVQLFRSEPFDAAIVFVRTREASISVTENLQANGYRVAALNGDIPQQQREKTVANLKQKRIDVLVATDVAARGLDVPRIDLVVNFDAPFDTESYVHRIGRTGRAGRSGNAILFINGRERRLLSLIEKTTRQPIESYQFPSAKELNQRRVQLFFDEVNQELDKDLGEYRSLVKQYLAQHDISAEELAAVLASQQRKNAAFFVKETDLLKPVSEKQTNKQKRKAKDQAQASERTPRKVTRHSDSEMETYRLAAGREQGISKGDILGAVANITGLDNADIGKIYLNDNDSSIELPAGMPKDVFNNLAKARLKGHPIGLEKLEGALERPQRERRPAGADKGRKKPSRDGAQKRRESGKSNPKPDKKSAKKPRKPSKKF